MPSSTAFFIRKTCVNLTSFSYSLYSFPLFSFDVMSVFVAGSCGIKRKKEKAVLDVMAPFSLCLVSLLKIKILGPIKFIKRRFLYTSQSLMWRIFSLQERKETSCKSSRLPSGCRRPILTHPSHPCDFSGYMCAFLISSGLIYDNVATSRGGPKDLYCHTESLRGGGGGGERKIFPRVNSELL